MARRGHQHRENREIGDAMLTLVILLVAVAILSGVVLASVGWGG